MEHIISMGKECLLKYKICIYAISKNEEKFVDRWMDSMGEADLIVVTDTGSKDDTVKKLQKRGAVVHEESIVPWRFDVARNISLSHVPEDVDIAVCTDLDEVLRPGWRKLLEEAWEPDATQGNYLFNWSLNPDGTSNTQFTYFKVHARNDYTWACPVHEYLHYIGTKPEKKVFIKDMILDHYPDHTKSRDSYLPLLEMAVEEKPDDVRMTYYLGREYMYVEQWENCISTLKRYLVLPESYWEEERCAAMRWIAKSNEMLHYPQEVYRWYYRAIGELPTMRDPYVEFAQYGYRQEDWITAYHMAKTALSITEKSDCFINMGYAWDQTPHDLAAIASYHMGLYKEAEEHGKAALAMAMGDERLKRNLESIQKKL
jgi:glycosyltransferase involved in cell wall biosynthesis